MTEQMGSGKRGSGHLGDKVIQYNGFQNHQVPMLNSYEGSGNYAISSKGVTPSALKTTGTSTGKKRTTSRRLGRRGDPRMHNAVKARLANPNLTLLDALLVGGFTFPNLEIQGLSDRLIIDSDSVSLCQRKNQLMRRLRIVKKEKTNKKLCDSSSISASDTEDASSLNKANNSPRKTEPTSKQHEKNNFSSLEHSSDASMSAAVSLHRQMLGEYAKLSQQATSIPSYLQAAPESKRDVFAAPSAMIDPSQGNIVFGQSGSSNDAMFSALKNMAQSNQNPTFTGCLNMPLYASIQPQIVPFNVQSNPFSTCIMSVPQNAGPIEPTTNGSAEQTVPFAMSSNPFSSDVMSAQQNFGNVEPTANNYSAPTAEQGNRKEQCDPSELEKLLFLTQKKG